MAENEQIISEVSYNIKRRVLCEKSSFQEQIRNLFLQLWDGCTLRAIGGEGAFEFYLVKNNSCYFELNRVAKVIHINDEHYENIFCKTFKKHHKKIEAEIILHKSISKTIKEDLKIDVDYNYLIRKVYNSQEEIMPHVYERSEQVDIKHLNSIAPDLDDEVEKIMKAVFDS